VLKILNGAGLTVRDRPLQRSAFLNDAGYFGASTLNGGYKFYAKISVEK